MLKKRVSYNVVDGKRRLEPVKLKEDGNVLIPAKECELIPNPVEVVDSEFVESVSSLPVGSIVARQPDGSRVHLFVRDYFLSRQAQVPLRDTEKHLLEDVIATYKAGFENPWAAENTPLVKALSLDERTGIYERLQGIPEVEKGMLVEVLKGLRREDRVFTAVEKNFMEELLYAVKPRRKS